MNVKEKTAIAALIVGMSLLAACSGGGGGSAGADHTQHSALPSAAPASADLAPAQKSPAPTPSAAASVKPSPSASSTAGASPSSGAAANASVKPSASAAGSQTSAGDPSRKSISWYYMKKGKGKVPGFPAETKQYKANQAVWVGTGKKVYLTLDNGGPMGDIDTMLKALKDNNVKANFFLAGYNVKAHPDFLKRLVAEGHLVANHTMSHKDMSTLPDAEVKKEIQDYEKMYTDIIGKPMPKFYRFPYGKYSMHLLDVVSDMGYTSVFWSTAMRDWEPMAGGPTQAYNDVMANLHDGNIILLHQGSDDDIKALDKIIKGIKNEGYSFGLLSDFGG